VMLGPSRVPLACQSGFRRWCRLLALRTNFVLCALLLLLLLLHAIRGRCLLWLQASSFKGGARLAIALFFSRADASVADFRFQISGLSFPVKVARYNC
jgi:phosphoglycerol transferase MdoB-like AlkP superfamily enzyme